MKRKVKVNLVCKGVEPRIALRILSKSGEETGQLAYLDFSEAEKLGREMRALIRHQTTCSHLREGVGIA